MKYLTIRNLPPELGRALEREKRQRKASLNQTVIDLLAQSLGVGGVHRRNNGIGALASTWTEQEFREFEEAVGVFEKIDDELWR